MRALIIFSFTSLLQPASTKEEHQPIALIAFHCAVRFSPKHTTTVHVVTLDCETTYVIIVTLAQQNALINFGFVVVVALATFGISIFFLCVV